MSSSSKRVSAAVSSELSVTDAEYTITRFETDPRMDVSLTLGLGGAGCLSLELTDEQAEQLAEDLLSAVKSAHEYKHPEVDQ